MSMIGCATRASAALKLDRYLPSARYLAAQGLPSRFKLHEMLLFESDGDWWFSTDSADKQCRLDGLTERQINVKLTTGHTHCPACKHDLAFEIPGKPHDYGFFDYFVDDYVRIQHEFACRKCRHQWGPICTGEPKNSSVAAIPAAQRATANPPGMISEPKAGSAGAAAYAVCDRVYARSDRPMDWKAFRLVVIAEAEAEGQNPGNVGTELPRWARVRKVFHFKEG